LEDGIFIKTKEVGPLELEPWDPDQESKSKPIFTKRTIDTIKDIFNNSENSILAVHDREGEDIQYVNHIKRHYQYYRKYTFGEMTAYYKDDGHIYV